MEAHRAVTQPRKGKGKGKGHFHLTSVVPSVNETAINGTREIGKLTFRALALRLSL